MNHTTVRWLFCDQAQPYSISIWSWTQRNQFLHPADNDSSDTEADSKNACIGQEQPAVRTHIYGNPHLDNRVACWPISNDYFDIFDDELDL
jgi:hypothetical protein